MYNFEPYKGFSVGKGKDITDSISYMNSSHSINFIETTLNKDHKHVMLIQKFSLRTLLLELDTLCINLHKCNQTKDYMTNLRASTNIDLLRCIY